MWNKRRDEEPARPYTPPGPALPQRPPVSLNPRRRQRRCPTCRRRSSPNAAEVPPRSERPSRSSARSTAKKICIVDGDVEGTVEAPDHKLTIGPNGTVHATVKAREVVALGSIQGNVEATDRIEITKDAKLIGDIRTARIVIEDGAYFKGSIDIVKPEPAKAAACRRPQQAARAGARAAVGGGAPEIKR